MHNLRFQSNRNAERAVQSVECIPRTHKFAVEKSVHAVITSIPNCVGTSVPEIVCSNGAETVTHMQRTDVLVPPEAELISPPLSSILFFAQGINQHQDKDELECEPIELVVNERSQAT